MVKLKLMGFCLLRLSVGFALDESEVHSELGLLLVKRAQLERVVARCEGKSGVVLLL